MSYSIIVPIFNEARSLAPLCTGIGNALANLGRTHEIILVDDGSSDDTLDRFNSLHWTDGRLALIRIRHKGKSYALQAGFDAAQGEIFITLDGDLQDDPKNIPKLIDKLDKGFDVVYGWRRRRRESFSKRAASWAANRLRRVLVGESIHDVGCGLRAFRKQVARKIRLTGGLHRFFSALAVQRGFRVGEVEVDHHPRRFGVSKYGTLDRLAEGATDWRRVFLSKSWPKTDGPPDYEIVDIVTKEGR